MPFNNFDIGLSGDCICTTKHTQLIKEKQESDHLDMYIYIWEDRQESKVITTQ